MMAAPNVQASAWRSVRRLRGTIRVLHIHGSLGGERWLGERRAESREYSHEASAEQRQFLAQHSIKLIHDEIDLKVIETARVYLKDADVVGFLGFGFHRMNLDRLGTEQLRGDHVVRATTLGFTPEEESARVRPRFLNSSIDLYNVDCMRFLRESPLLHSDQQRQ